MRLLEMVDFADMYRPQWIACHHRRVADFKSEWPRSNRNQWPTLGIRGRFAGPTRGRHQRSRYGHGEDKGRPRAPGNHLILASPQQNIIGAEAIADRLTVDGCSKSVAEVAHMISFMALLDHEVISRQPERPGVIEHEIWLA